MRQSEVTNMGTVIIIEIPEIWIFLTLSNIW